ncbi:MAG: phosphoenolpyruvate--protein phosphotransferase [Pseudobutyrivibrio sp.]|nr:phosphoenolpyruvate--protein phosphotransferase [Pseudobutyrivibrio sp.]
MKAIKGKSVYTGTAIGKIHVYSKEQQQVKRVKVENTASEIERYNQACEVAKEQLGKLYDKACQEVGEDSAAIFEIHQMMLEDLDYKDSVENIISTQEVNAEYAVAETGDNFAQMFAAMDDEYMQARSADIKDISERLIGVLSGNNSGKLNTDEPTIIVADDLAPSETVQMDKDKVLAFVTRHGSVNSHTAILARTMGIPALVACGDELTFEGLEGKKGIVEGASGTFIVEPDEAVLFEKTNQRELELKQKELLQTLKGKENVTIDGRKIMLYANIGNIKDLGSVLQNDAGGIGLFRSEFIYLEKNDFPTEEEQFNIYKTVVETMAGKRVIIRTLDIGADKKCDYFNMPAEENPAMGRRAIRICLTQPEIFKTQLRALFRASLYGKLAIMYPMITSVNEVLRIKEIVEEVKSELTQQEIPFGKPEQGIMIETPAAVMVAQDLAKLVDFFSIGTNDLTQYTLAIDRQNESLDSFYDPHHPAVLRMIKMVVDASHEAGIWTGICGELGADTALTRTFLEMGVDELSVSPKAILPIRKIVVETNLSK